MRTLPPLRPPKCENEAHRLLDIAPEDIKKMTPEECADAVVILSIYATYLQRACQKSLSLANALTRKVKLATAGRQSRDARIGFEERYHMTIKGDPEILELDNERAKAQSQYDRLCYVSQRVREVAEAYQACAHVKNRKREHGEI